MCPFFTCNSIVSCSHRRDFHGKLVLRKLRADKDICQLFSFCPFFLHAPSRLSRVQYDKRRGSLVQIELRGQNLGSSHRVVADAAVVVEHLHLHRPERVLHRKAEPLFPFRIQVFENGSALIELLSANFELDVRITGACNENNVFVGQWFRCSCPATRTKCQNLSLNEVIMNYQQGTVCKTINKPWASVTRQALSICQLSWEDLFLRTGSSCNPFKLRRQSEVSNDQKHVCWDVHSFLPRAATTYHTDHQHCVAKCAHHLFVVFSSK